MDFIISVATVVALLLLVAGAIRFWRARKNKRKQLVLRAVQEQGREVLPSNVFMQVNQIKGIAMSEEELIHLLYQLVDDGLVQEHKLSKLDKVRLARKILKGSYSRASRLPVKDIDIIARFSLTQEGHQQAA